MVKTRGIEPKNYKEKDEDDLSQGDTTMSYSSSSSPEQPDHDKDTPAASTKRSAITKKRPYRRTKRPAGYNDKSSITTTTETFQPVSAYDAVLQESQDLCQAAAEAQQLGRLKMSAAYLLLLHTRLVGLGKRFDKAIAVAERGEDAASSPSKQLQAQQQATQAELARLLPTNIELDNDMMEHLARAAAELHAARTGKSHSLTSPTAREFLAGTANQQGVTNAATVTGVAKAVAAIEQQEAQYWNNNNNNTKKGVSDKTIDSAAAAVEEEVDELDKYMPGRNKPATTAMRTVPHANCDAKSLLFGAPFEAAIGSPSRHQHSSPSASSEKKQKSDDDTPESSQKEQKTDGDIDVVAV